MSSAPPPSSSSSLLSVGDASLPDRAPTPAEAEAAMMALQFMDSEKYVRQLREAADYIHHRLGDRAEVALVLGSGLSNFADELEDQTEIPYEDIPHMPPITVSGHGSRLLFGRVGTKKLYCFSGRHHTYEGKPFWEVCFIVRLSAYLGCKAYVLTNASGGSQQGMYPGCFMLITDHLRFTFRDPLIDTTGDHRLGERYVDLSNCWSKRLSDEVRAVAKDIGCDLFEGTYGWTQGPGYETRAEVLTAHRLGASCFGMSSVPEAIAAAALGMEVVGVSCITNLAAGLAEEVLEHDSVKDVGVRSGPMFTKLMSTFISRMTLRQHGPEKYTTRPFESRGVPMSAKYERVTYTEKDVEPAVEYIRTQLRGMQPNCVIVTYGGLEVLTQRLDDPSLFDLNNVPNFPRISLTHDRGKFAAGVLPNGCCVLCASSNCLEGFRCHEASFLAVIIKRLGIQNAIVSLSAADLHECPSDIKIQRVSDVINHSSFLPMSRMTGLTGDFDYIIAEDGTFHLFDDATEETIPSSSVYAYLGGPSFCTPAEAKMFAELGVRVAGITSPEILYSLRALHISVEAVSAISFGFNPDTHRLQCPLWSSNVEDAAFEATPNIVGWVLDNSEKISDWTERTSLSSPVGSPVQKDAVLQYRFRQPVFVRGYFPGISPEEVDEGLAVLRPWLASCGCDVPGIPHFMDFGSGIHWAEVFDEGTRSVLEGHEIPNLLAEVGPLFWQSLRYMAGEIRGQKVVVCSCPSSGTSWVVAPRLSYPMRMSGVLQAGNITLIPEMSRQTKTLSVDIVVVNEHINFTGYSPLCGPNYDQWGPRFFDMQSSHNEPMRRLVIEAAHKLNFSIEEGLCAFSLNQNLETIAQKRAYNRLGALVSCHCAIPESAIAQHMSIPCTILGQLVGFPPRGNKVAKLVKEIAPALGDLASSHHRARSNPSSSSS